MPRKDQRAKCNCYLRGLMLDGRRKSIQAMAARLSNGNERNLHQLVNQSTWDPVPVQRRITERMPALINPMAWVAPLYCGALGKRANWQGAVNIHAATDTASCPLQWRLLLPKEWTSDIVRRALTGIPAHVMHLEKWCLALDMLDTLAGWSMTPPVVVAEATYGTNARLRTALADRSLACMPALRSDVVAQPLDTKPITPARNGPVGCWPSPATGTPHPRWQPCSAASDRRHSSPHPLNRAGGTGSCPTAGC